MQKICYVMLLHYPILTMGFVFSSEILCLKGLKAKISVFNKKKESGLKKA